MERPARQIIHDACLAEVTQGCGGSIPRHTLWVSKLIAISCTLAMSKAVMKLGDLEALLVNHDRKTDVRKWAR